jgi:hypothetical protein
MELGMRRLSKITTETLLVLSLAATAASAGPAPASNPGPTPHAAPSISPSRAGMVARDPCSPASARSRLLEWLRAARGHGWSHRNARNEDIERPAVPFYLRSQLLTGFYSRTDGAACPPSGPARDAESTDRCAELIIRTSLARDLRIDVLLPQLDAKSPRQLRDTILERLDRGERVDVLARAGERYEIDPALTHDVGARGCSEP